MPERTLGIIGAGQLARMLASAAWQLGVSVHVLARTQADCAAHTTPHTYQGNWQDFATLQTFAQQVDILTVEHDHLPPDHAQGLIRAGHALRPGPQAIALAHDKLHMRQSLTKLGLPAPRWAAVASASHLRAWGDDCGWPLVLKTPRGGYDGRGVRVLETPPDTGRCADWFAHYGTLLVEEKVHFRRELAVMVARRPGGELRCWDVVESLNVAGMCQDVIAPAPGISPPLAAAIQESAIAIATAVQLEGTMAVEVFETDTAPTGFVINEVAIRPHNTGHWTLDGSLTSQFEQHVRAVCDLPLGATDRRAPWTRMRNLLGPATGSFDLPTALTQPELKIHLYGKETRPGRKIGHVNALATDAHCTPTELGHQLDRLSAARPASTPTPSNQQHLSREDSP